MDHEPMCVEAAGQVWMLKLHADNLDIHFIVSFSGVKIQQPSLYLLMLKYCANRLHFAIEIENLQHFEIITRYIATFVNNDSCL